jgi:DNA polymerase-1
MEKLYLIDGMSLVFRAYHAFIKSGLTSPDGELTGAVFGFANMLTSIIEKQNPGNLAVVFDSREPTFRHEKYEEYKANRDEFPEDLEPQLERIKELLDIMNIPRFRKSGYEADDIIGTISRRAAQNGSDVYCITSDKDFYQLVQDHVRLLKPSRKGSDFDEIDIEGVKEKFGVEPEKVIDVLALMGDTSDNIPGVKGIGPKTAAPLIQQFGSLEDLYDNLDEIDKKAVRKKLEDNKDNAFLSKYLVTIKLDVDLDIDYDDLNRKEPDYVALDKYFKQLGFNQLRKKWFDKGVEKGLKKNDADDTPQPAISSIGDIGHDYQLVDTPEKLSAMADYLKKFDLISVDLETSSLDRQSCEIVGIALAAEEGKAFYVATSEKKSEKSAVNSDSQNSLFAEKSDDKDTAIRLAREKCIDFALVKNELLEILTGDEYKICGQNLKFDSYILKRKGIELRPIAFDSMIGSYVLNPDDQHGMDALALRWLNYRPVPITTLIGEKKRTQKSMSEIDPAEISDYACEDADVALRLRNRLLPELEKYGSLELAENIEFPMINVLTRMEYNGVAIDTGALAEMSVKIAAEADSLTKKIYDEAGIEFNIDSPKQLGHILFEKMMIPPVRKTKTGYSTDVQVLTQLSETYPIADMILQYRQLVKLKSTYVDALPRLINPETGRIHTTFNQTVASTGRLSSTDPNLQNIPIRTDLGKEIRRAFIPQSEGSIIFAADYSQVELRIMAHICGDEQMIRGFEEGLDIHSATSSALFGVPLDEVTGDMRRIAKTVNFGIMYGLGAFGLSSRLGIPRGEAQEIIDNYFEKYPGIRKYIDETIEKGHSLGYAETLCGRKRYFPEINSKNRNMRTAAERAAINMPIQGTAADMMKIAMIRIDEELRRRNMKSLMMLQVHDELVFEAKTEELDELREMVVGKMETAVKLGKVPVSVDTGTGKNWFEAH